MDSKFVEFITKNIVKQEVFTYNLLIVNVFYKAICLYKP